MQFSDIIHWLLDDILGQLLLTAAGIAAAVVLRNALIREIRGKSEFLSEQQRRGISYTRNGIFLLILVIITLLWADEIKHFALSVAAVTVALVLATKELLLCISGSILRASVGAFSIGDWIEIDDTRGEVIHYNLFATIIQEIAGGNRYHYTGRTITIPNSIFLSSSVRNLNFMRRYVFHTFTVTFDERLDPFAVITPLRKRAEAECANFMEVARRYNRVIESRAGLDIPSPDPQIEIDSTNEGRNTLTVTLFCPTDQAVGIEHALRQDIHELLHPSA